jgi:KR domain
MQRALEYHEKGFITPITPTMEFDATNIYEPFRYLQKGQHIGKVIVTMPEKSEELPQEGIPKHFKLRPDRTYLFVGGLGGLGRSIAAWLTELGVKHITFFSRSAGSIRQDDSFVKELAAAGCAVTTISGSVCDYNDVVQATKATSLPVGGVLQASMVLNVCSIPPLELNGVYLTSHDKGYRHERYVLGPVASCCAAQGAGHLESAQRRLAPGRAPRLLLPLQLRRCDERSVGSSKL